MNETYVEWLIKRKNTWKGILMRVFSVFLILVCVVIFLYFGSIGMLAEIAACYLAFYIFKWTSIEYEYCYITGELIIDKVMGKYKRKRCALVDMNLVEVVAPKGHKALEEFENKPCKAKNYTSLMNLNTVYVVYYRKDSDLLKLEFEPNSKIVEGMQMQAPRKVFI